MEPLKPRVFISYKSEGRPFVEVLDDDLRGAQIDVWLDVREIQPGESILKKLFVSGIPTCDVFVAYITSDYLTSKWTTEELETALTHILNNGRITPFLIVDCDSTRMQLPLNIAKYNIPVIDEKSYAAILARLVSVSWKSLQEWGKLVTRVDSLSCQTTAFPVGGEYHLDTMLTKRATTSLIVAGATLRAWLGEPSRRLAVIRKIKSNKDLMVSFVLAEHDILEHMGDGKTDLQDSIKQLVSMRNILEEDADRLHTYFHWAAATLSAVVCNAEAKDGSGVMTVTARWGTQAATENRFAFIIEKSDNPRIFDSVYSSLLAVMRVAKTDLQQLARIP